MTALRSRRSIALLLTLAISSPSLGAANSWLTATSGNWSDPTKWSLGIPPNNGNLPGTTYDVLLNATGSPYAVTLDTSVTINNLTVGPNTTLASMPDVTTQIINNGVIQVGSAPNSISAEFINNGILAVAANLYIGFGQAGPVAWSNPGTITLTPHIFLGLGGSFSTDDFNHIQINGAYIGLQGSLDNSSRTFSLSAVTGTMSFSGTIVGGVISATGGAYLSSSAGATLDHVTLGAASFPILRAWQSLNVLNGLIFDNASIALIGPNGGDNEMMVATSGPTPFSGSGTLLIQGPVRITNTGAATFTIPAAMTLRTSVKVTGANPAAVISMPSSSITNSGLVSAEVPNSAIFLDSASINNLGTLQAIDGGMIGIYGTFSNAGTIDNTGGILAFSNFSPSLFSSIANHGVIAIARSTYDNSISVFSVSAATGEFGLVDGAVFTGGTITSTDHTPVHIIQVPNPNGSNSPHTTYFSTLDGVTLATDLLIHSSAALRVRNNLFLDGAVISLGIPGQVLPKGISSVQTAIETLDNSSLLGSGTIVLNDASAIIWPNGNLNTLTIGPGVTVVTGASGGTIGVAGVNTGSWNILNQGSILAQSAGQTLTLAGSAFSNQGTISASNGGILSLLNLSNVSSGVISADHATASFLVNFTNSGSMVFNASTLVLNASTSGLGSLTLNDSLVYLFDPSTLTAPASITRTGGTVALGTSYSPGTPTLDVTTTRWGFLTFSNGAALSNLTLTASSGNITIFNASNNIYSPYTAFTGTTLAANTDIMNGAELRSFSNLTLANTAIFLNSASTTTTLSFQGSQLLTGTGTIISNGATGGFFDTLAVTSGTLTIDTNITIQTGTANLSLNASNAFLINKGAIDAQNPGTRLAVSSNIITNLGSLRSDANAYLSVFAPNLNNQGIVEAYPASSLTLGAYNFTNQGPIHAFPNSLLAVNANNFTNQSFIRADPGSTLTLYGPFVNNGQISVDGATLNLFPINALSTGTLQVTNSTINVLGGWTLPQFLALPPTNTFSFGSSNYAGVLYLAGATLNLASTTLTLWNGTLLGGAVIGNNDALITGGNSSLTDLSLSVPLTISGSTLTLTGNLALNAPLTFTGGSPATPGKFNFAATTSSAQTISGIAEIIFNGNSTLQIANPADYPYSPSLKDHPVIFGPGIDIHTGSAGALLSIGTLTLLGNISARSPGLDIAIITANFTQQGTIEATNGASIHISTPTYSFNTFINSTGFVHADGGVLSFDGGYSGSITCSGAILIENGGAITFNSRFLIVNSPIALANGIVNFNAENQSISTVAGPGTVTLSVARALTSDGINTNSLIVNGTQTIRPNGSASGTSKLASLLFGIVGNLDLTNNKLILQSADPSDKAAKIYQLNFAISSAAGSEGGLISSTAAADPSHYSLGIFDNALLQLTSFGGQPVDSNSILTTIAHLGDANGNGIVDIQDLTLIANNWQQPANNWAAGDLNRDNIVDIQDFTIVANNWQQSSAFPLYPAPYPLSPASAPEPSSLLLLSLLSPLLLRPKSSKR